VQCGTPVHEGYPEARIVQVPVQRFVLNVQAFGSTLVRLGVTDRLVGVQSFNSYTTPEILERGRQGHIHEVGSRSHSPLEPTIAADPDVVFLFYSAYPDSNLHPQLWELGVEGVPLAGHFEATPLGHSEWIKYFALFFNQERTAAEIFTPAASRYKELARLASGVSPRPQVLLGAPSGRDVWNLNGGKNFVARFIQDAGGEYFWQVNEEAGSLVTADFERIMDESFGTGFWVAPNYISRVASRREMVRSDARLAFFTPVERDGVHAQDRGRDKRGASPAADQSLDKPDVVLADFIRALHPGLLDDSNPVFFRKLR
jgi:iron complex transport system substrate-binding protein